MTRILKRSNFVWRGLALHFGKSRKPILTLDQDSTYPHLYRIRYPNGWQSVPGNITRAKDAAYGHASYLMGEETGAGAAHSRETGKEQPQLREAST
jgi:hypothetical protein